MSLETEVLTIDGLTTDTLRVIDERAILTGKSREEYVVSVLERDAKMPLSLRELYAPVREQIAESGISEDELDALIEAAREESWRERQAGIPNGNRRPTQALHLL